MFTLFLKSFFAKCIPYQTKLDDGEIAEHP